MFKNECDWEERGWKGRIVCQRNASGFGAAECEAVCGRWSDCAVRTGRVYLANGRE